jgi:hypothetical protein
MGAFYVTIETPLGDRHKTVRGTDIKTEEDAKAHVRDLQAKQGWKSSLPMAPQGEIAACVPAVWPDHFKSRPAAMDAAYPQPLTRQELLK